MPTVGQKEGGAGDKGGGGAGGRRVRGRAGDRAWVKGSREGEGQETKGKEQNIL